MKAAMEQSPELIAMERYEICELVADGRAGARRVLAAAGTPAAARLARRTLYEEGEARHGSLVIRDAATGRRLPG